MTHAWPSLIWLVRLHPPTHPHMCVPSHLLQFISSGSESLSHLCLISHLVAKQQLLQGRWVQHGRWGPLAAVPFIVYLRNPPPHTHTVPMCASLSSQSGVWQLLTTLLSKLKSTDVRRFPVYASSCLDQDSLSELLHSLATMADNYQTESCPEEDSDSDD